MLGNKYSKIVRSTINYLNKLFLFKISICFVIESTLEIAIHIKHSRM